MHCSKIVFAGKRAPTGDRRNTGDLSRTQKTVDPGDTGDLSRTQKTVDPGDTGDLSRTQNPAIRLTPPTFGVRKICRSRLAGERGQPGHECIAVRSSSRASALLQVIGATPATFGVRKIRRSGDTDRLRRSQDPTIRAIPATFRVRKIRQPG
jgi:hypothetical protein